MRALGLTVVWLGACTMQPTPAGGDTDHTGTDVVAGPTFHEDVRPILERHCTGCHQPGGIGAMSLVWDEADPEAVAAWFGPLARAVEAGTMPPWPPDEACHPTEHPRVLPDAEKSMIAAWAEADFPLGRASAYDPPRIDPVELPEPDLVLGPDEAYTPSRETSDDYRCFVLDPGLDRDRFLQGFQVVPGRVDVVHHVLIYRVDDDLDGLLRSWDEADPGPGYTCFGAVSPAGADLPGLALTLAGWAPGQAPERYDAKTARRIEQGSRLVMQVHYNTANLAPDAEAPEDRTKLDLWLRPPDDPPFWEIFSVPLPKTDLHVPAGDADHTEELIVDLADVLPRQVIAHVRGTFPHMHQLGRSIRVDVIRDDGSEECVVDVPRWDFHWQQSYLFPYDEARNVDATIPIGARSKLRLRCTYDNSAANQPIVGGVRQEPRDVTWGEATEDEMCLAYIYAMVPAGSIPPVIAAR